MLKYKSWEKFSSLPKKFDTFGHKVPGSNPGQDKLFVKVLELIFYYILSTILLFAFNAAEANLKTNMVQN